MFNILVVEDEKSVNDLITMNLSLVGYRFDKAFDRLNTLKKVKEQKFHLILLDVLIPYIDGFEFIEKIKGYNILVI